MSMMLFGGILWVFLLVLVGWAFLHYMRGSGQGDGYLPGGDGSRTGLAILEERCARGEIEREEHLQKERNLLGDDRGR